LLIYTHNGTVKLDIGLSAKFCRISAGENGDIPNPKTAPNFCMLLRKHLQNAEILAVEQAGFERVIYFDLKCFSEFEITEMRLYLEIMGKYSNAVLTKGGVIVGALKTASLETGARRVMMSGAKYSLPEKQDKCDPTDLTALENAFAEGTLGDAAKFIADRVAGIAFVTACDMVNVYGESITAQNVYDYVNGNDYTPCVIYRNGEPIDFCARAAFGGIKRESILKAQAEFYGYAVRKKAFADRKRKLVSALSSAQKKVEKRLAGIFDKLSECEKCSDIKLRGELITANIYAIERGASRFSAVNYYDEKQSEIIIDLDPSLTPSQNAQKYFKRYAKLKRTETNLTAQRTECQARLDYLKTIAGNLNLAEDMRDLDETEEELITLSLLPAPKSNDKKRKKKESESPFRRYVCGDFTVLCGRNNAQNDRLVKSLAPTDLWLHAKNFHSAHVAVLCGGKQPDDSVIKFAAEICAYYSDAQANDKVPVDFTTKKYVKKPNGANLGFVVYTDFKTILVAPNAHTEDRCDE
ncbi:MAG: NFACT family protein, partial [Clostridia bacterium]|nr:NFACT family protein [Clostridia bacterium]